MCKLSVIIVAAGKGLRMGGELPKQFLSLSSRPILMLTIDKFATALPNAQIIVAINPDYVDYWNTLCVEHNFNVPHKVVIGGHTRFESVKNCVNEVLDEIHYVLIHDGVRPFVSNDLIHRVKEGVKQYGAVVPAVDVVDSLRRAESEKASVAVDRTSLKAVQTPQAFEKDILKKSYNQPYNSTFTDDASVVEACGYQIAIVEGERVNIKITTTEDIFYGNFLLKIAKN